MAHLAAGDTVAAQLVAGEPAEELDEFRADARATTRSPSTRFNAWTVNRRSGARDAGGPHDVGPGRRVLPGVRAPRCRTRTGRERRFDYVAGPIAARYLVQSRIVEWWLHGEDMRATNGLGPQWQHWPIYLTIDLGVRMLPWTLGQAGYDLSGRDASRSRSRAPGEGSWHWGLGLRRGARRRREAGRRDPGPRAPARARGGPRVSTSTTCSLSGNVVLGGERELAETVLRHLRAYPVALDRAPQARRASRSYSLRVACCACDRESPSTTPR